MLHNVSARFEAGKAYAIVGGSGSGKSTLLNLLMAANTEYSGSITLDGIEIRDIAPESLYDIISVIQQNVFVFNASIKDNVSMFRSFDNAELDDAIRRAHLGELIAEHGENYLCGENGSALSVPKDARELKNALTPKNPPTISAMPSRIISSLFIVNALSALFSRRLTIIHQS